MNRETNLDLGHRRTLVIIPSKLLGGYKEMSQQLRAMTALPGDQGLVPSTHMEAHHLLRHQV